MRTNAAPRYLSTLSCNWSAGRVSKESAFDSRSLPGPAMRFDGAASIAVLDASSRAFRFAWYSAALARFSKSPRFNLQNGQRSTLARNLRLHCGFGHSLYGSGFGLLPLSAILLSLT